MTIKVLLLEIQKNFSRKNDWMLTIMYDDFG